MARTPKLPDSGARREFSTGAVRDASAGKGMPFCVPPAALRAIWKRFEDGAAKYALHNWMRGISFSAYVNSINRHILAFQENDATEDHLGAVLWNAACLMWTRDEVAAGRLPATLNDLPFWPGAVDLSTVAQDDRKQKRRQKQARS